MPASSGHIAQASVGNRVGRLGHADEIRIVKDTLGPQAVITGFYSNGEFYPDSNSPQSVLHNQTMTIGYLVEDMTA